MWPFKRKGLIDSDYLMTNGISTKFSTAFQLSKSQLKKHLQELEQQHVVWNKELGDLHTNQKMHERKMERLLEEINATDTAEHSERALFVKLDQLEREYKQDSKSVQEAMMQLRQVQKTRWLLGSILDGTFSDPELLSEPPQRGWAGDWEDLFDGETLEELRERFGVKKAESSAEDAPANDDDVDPGI